jgi:IclR family transcriptional regulator, pca regulon regulatory protein
MSAKGQKIVYPSEYRQNEQRQMTQPAQASPSSPNSPSKLKAKSIGQSHSPSHSPSHSQSHTQSHSQSQAHLPVKSKDFVSSLERGIRIIRAFDATDKEMTLSEVAAKTGLTRAGARRFLLTLSELGYIRHVGRNFSLTAKVLSLGYAYMAATPIGEIAQPYLDDVTRETGESCSMAVLDGVDIAYITRSRTNRLLMLGIHVGARLPALTTSMGRVLLANMPPNELDAFLAEVTIEAKTSRTLTDPELIRNELRLARRQDYYVLDQELENGLRSIAVPVRSQHSGRPISAINIATNVAIVSRRRLVEDCLPALKRAAKKIERAVV